MENLKILKKNYKKTSKSEILEILSRITLIGKKVHSSRTDFYVISDKQKAKVMEKPRKFSHSYDPDLDESKKIDISLYKCDEFQFLVKSSSRFFLKPDIGEVIDQMDESQKKNCKMLYIDLSNHEIIPNTDREHFLVKACSFYWDLLYYLDL